MGQYDPRRPLDYRNPRTADPRDQWLRDDQAFGGCLVYGLLAGTVILAILGGIAGLAWWLLAF